MEIEIIVEPLDEITFGVQSPTIGVPKGGTTGQVLSKNSDADYDTEWESVEAAAIPDNSIAKVKLVEAVRLTLDKADTSVQQVAGKGLSTNDYTNTEKAKLATIETGAEVNTVDSVNGQVGTVVLVKADVGLSNVDNTTDLNKPISTSTQTALDLKVDKVAGKGLSDENYTLSEKNKLAGIAANANNYVHPNHSGDVVSAGDGATTIQPNVVTFAKFQEIGGQKLVGRSNAGNGDAGQIGLGGGLEFNGSNVRREALTGAVTAGAGSNTTALGSFTKAQLDTAVSDGTLLAETVAATGAVIDFTTSKVFNSPASPSDANITDNLTGAKIGIVQKIYHNHSVAPSVPAGWVLIGSGTYTLSTLNIIFAEWVSSTRVEYWIVQPA